VRLRDRRSRQKHDLTVIDGLREINRAIKSNVQITQAFILDTQQDALRDTSLQLADAGAEILIVTNRVFEKLAFGNRCEGVVATAKPPHRSLVDLPASGDAVIGVIESVEKPGNVGAIIRSADAAGVDGLIVANPGTDLFNPNAIRASLGTIFSMPICVTTSADAKSWLADSGTNIFVARVDGALDYTQVVLRGRIAIVLGSEADGVSPVWRDASIRGIKLPMHGLADSLNVSVTAAILFYEALRQRT
jgi:TrmH family RNA methyltransferase